MYSIGFLIGCLGLMQLSALPALWLLGAGCILSFGIGWWFKEKKIGIIRKYEICWGKMLVFVGCCFLGLFWQGWHCKGLLEKQLRGDEEGKEKIIEGRVNDIPVCAADHCTFSFVVDKDQRKYRLSWYGLERALHAGEAWKLVVRLKRIHGSMNPGGFDFEAWSWQQHLNGMGYVLNTAKNKYLGVRNGYAFTRWREKLLGECKNSLRDNPLAGIITALNLGWTQDIPYYQKVIAQRTGTAHLLAISGLHVGMVAGIVFFLVCGLWSKFTRFTELIPTPTIGALFAMSCAILYSEMAGFSCSTQRACIMCAILFIPKFFHRHMTVKIAFYRSLWIVLLWDPCVVLSSGFWLSFGAVFVLINAHQITLLKKQQYSALPKVGVRIRSSFREWLARLPLAALYFPPRTSGFFTYLTDETSFLHLTNLKLRIQKFLKNKTLNGLQLLHTQWICLIGLLPLSCWYFHQVSLISIVANFIAIPLVGVLVLPLILLGSGFVHTKLFLSKFFFTLAAKVLALLGVMLHWLSLQQWAVWNYSFSSMWEIIVVFVGCGLLVFSQNNSRWLGILGLIPLTLPTLSPLHQGQFKLSVLDVGQGLATVVTTRHHTIIYDTGAKLSPQLDSGQQIVIPYCLNEKIRRVDALILSHGDNDHAGGATSIVKALPVKKIYTSAVEKISDQLKDQSISSILSGCYRGLKWEWDQVRFEFLHPDTSVSMKSNDRSCVLKVSSAYGSVLFTGDIEKTGEQLLTQQRSGQLTSDILIVPHHGSKTSSTWRFIEAVNPQVAIFSYGYRNRYRHPSQEVVRRYLKKGIRLFNTVDSGALSTIIGEHHGSWLQYRSHHQEFWRLHPVVKISE